MLPYFGMGSMWNMNCNHLYKAPVKFCRSVKFSYRKKLKWLKIGHVSAKSKKLFTAESDGFPNSPWQDFSYAVQMDVAGKYWMFWTPDDETQTITFEVKYLDFAIINSIRINIISKFK